MSYCICITAKLRSRHSHVHILSLWHATHHDNSLTKHTQQYDALNESTKPKRSDSSQPTGRVADEVEVSREHRHEDVRRLQQGHDCMSGKVGLEQENDVVGLARFQLAFIYNELKHL